MPKLLVISDVHNRPHIADAIESFEPDADRVIYTGDFFDSWDDTPELNGATAKWLKTKLDNPNKYVVMTGNHDFAYIWPYNKYAYCSGYGVLKREAIYQNIAKEDLLKLKLAYFEANIMFSHAGIDRWLFPLLNKMGYETPQIINYDSLKSYIDKVTPEINEIYDKGSNHPLMEVGYDRGGDQQIGGIIWRDLGGHLAISGLNQIVGHSIRDEPIFQFLNNEKIPQYVKVFGGLGKQPKEEYFKRGFTLGFDTVNRHYIVIENGYLSITKVNRIYDKIKNIYHSPTKGDTILKVKYV